jgi:hypothetical protein
LSAKQPISQALAQMHSVVNYDAGDDLSMPTMI